MCPKAPLNEPHFVSDAPRSVQELDLELVRARVGSSLFRNTPAPVRLGRFELVRRIGRGATGVKAAMHQIDAQTSYALHALRDLQARANVREPIPELPVRSDVFANITVRDPERWMATFGLSFR